MRIVKLGAKRLDSVWHKGIKHTLMYHQGKKYYLRDPRWRDVVIPEENLSAGLVDFTFQITPVAYTDMFLGDDNISVGLSAFFNPAQPIYPNVVSAENDDEFTIRLFFNHVIDADLSAVAGAFSIKDSTNVPFTILGVAAGSTNAEIVFTMSNFTSASGNLLITYNPAIIQLECINQGSRFAIEAFTFSFLPVLIPPEMFAFENISVGTVIYFEPKRMNYIPAYSAGDNLSAAVSNISFVVTRVNLENPSPL